MRAFARLCLFVLPLFTISWAQVQRVGRPDDYYSYQGKFTITPHKVFMMIPMEERGKETGTLVQFIEERRRPTATIKASISLYKNTAGLTLKQWADAGRRSWITEPGYKEEKWEEVDWMGGKAWVHTFQFALADVQGVPRDRFRMKSIRYMRNGQGYWFVFYATPKFFDEYVYFWDAMLKTIKWDDEKEKPKNGG